MASYWDEHAHADLDAYVGCVEAAKRAGLPVVLGLEVDYYRGRMEDVATLLAGYPFDVLLGSVHWIGTWRFDDLDDPVSMDQWTARDVDAAWSDYVTAIEELAASGTCDVLAHPDLVKVAGYRPLAPEECWDRLVEAAVSSGMAAELSSAGWRKPVDRGLPVAGAAGAVRPSRGSAHDGVRRPPAGRRGRSVGRAGRPAGRPRGQDPPGFSGPATARRVRGGGQVGP
jgi:histidinol-phosphatase (PHP family)